MELPQGLETNEDWDTWEAQLLSCEKEELVQCMLSRMAMDSRFMKYVFASLSQKEPQEEEIEEQLSFYSREVEREYFEKVPDVEYLQSLTERFFQTAETMQNVFWKVKAYCTVILKLDEAIHHGAGLRNDDDWLLFEEMEDAAKKIVACAVLSEISEEQKKHILAYLQDMLKAYDPAEVNYLQKILDQIK